MHGVALIPESWHRDARSGPSGTGVGIKIGIKDDLPGNERPPTTDVAD